MIALVATLLAAAAPAPLETALQAVAARSPGKVGFAVLHLPSGRAAAVNGRAAFPTMSVAKLPTAILVLRQIDAGRRRLEEEVTVTAAQVAPGQAVAERWGDVPKRVSVARLLELSIGVSDNTAHDVLLKLAGGPQAANRELRALGLRGLTVLDLYRRQGRAGKRLTTVGEATPEAMIGVLRALHDGKLLAPMTRERLMQWMFDSPVGSDRLKGGVPSGTAVAHKTGTGQTTTNDVGVIPLPAGRGHLLVAAFVDGVRHGPEASATIAALARAAYDHFAAAAEE